MAAANVAALMAAIGETAPLSAPPPGYCCATDIAESTGMSVGAAKCVLLKHYRAGKLDRVGVLRAGTRTYFYGQKKAKDR